MQSIFGLMAYPKNLPALPFCQVTLNAKRPVSPAYPKSLKTFGDHLRKKRLDLSLRQKDVSQILGVSEASIWYWEKNLTSPSLHHLPKVIEFLGYVPYKTSPQTLKHLDEGDVDHNHHNCLL
jgi:DNA-binding XRE family transcriptional regulator